MIDAEGREFRAWCNRCNRERETVVGCCPKCGGVEYRIENTGQRVLGFENEKPAKGKV